MRKPAKFFLACVVFLALALPVLTVVVAYQDVRNQNLSNEVLNDDLIRSFWFNQGTIFPVIFNSFAQSVLIGGKNPGLGVRDLHQQGFTGRDVNVAIIDQNLSQDVFWPSGHAEFHGKLIHYVDLGTGMPPDESSMHGPAVLSLLVGETIGTAPRALVYYVAVPSWKEDADYYANALKVITAASINQNLNIRVVSISAQPAGAGSTFKHQKAYVQAVHYAEQAGILVLDCTQDRRLSIYHSFYDTNDPENVSLCTAGQPGLPYPHTSSPNEICAPNGHRTQAEQYYTGIHHYQYMGRGGLSWSVPYVAGVLALGWEVKPKLSGQQMVDLLLMSAYHKNGCNFINPQEFIHQVMNAK